MAQKTFIFNNEKYSSYFFLRVLNRKNNERLLKFLKFMITHHTETEYVLHPEK